MKNYQYQLVQYVHDQFTGEFLNVGVIVYSPDSYYLTCKITHKTQRIVHCFPEANGKFITKVLRNLETRIHAVSKQLTELYQPSVQLEQITTAILPMDDSAIQLSVVRNGIDIHMDAALQTLFTELVEKYEAEKQDKLTLSDEDVWRLKYKKYFDQYKVSEKLIAHKVTTKSDIFLFDKAWKNGIWHCFEPVSFALKNEESIKDKVYKWAGRLQGIQQGNEKISLTLLASLNQEHVSLKKLINNYLRIETDKIEVNIIMDNDAEYTAKKIKQLIEEHTEN